MPQKNDYLIVESISITTERNGQSGTTISYPFDKYYMNEEKVKPAENLLLKAQRDTSLVTYAQVAILDGEAQVLRVNIGDENIIDMVEKNE